LSYVEALSTVFVTVAQMLDLQSGPKEFLIDGMKIDSAHAIENCDITVFCCHVSMNS